MKRAPVIPHEPVYEVRCSVRRCDWRVAINTPEMLEELWQAHRAWHLRQQRAPQESDIEEGSEFDGPVCI